jgi:hypothetical protein
VQFAYGKGKHNKETTRTFGTTDTTIFGTGSRMVASSLLLTIYILQFTNDSQVIIAIEKLKDISGDAFIKFRQI